MTATAHVDTFARDHLPPRDAVARARSSSCRSCSYPARLNCGDRAARPRASSAAGAIASAILAPDGVALDATRELVAQRQPDRARARRGPRPRARQPRAAARPEQPDDGGVLVRRAQGRRHRGRRRCRCCARGSSPTSSTRRRSRTRCATRGSPRSSTPRVPHARRCATSRMFGERRGRRPRGAGARASRRRSPTSTPRPTTPR